MQMKREARGFWWSPDRPEVRAFGVLQHSDGGSPELELFPQSSGRSEAAEFGTVIHGIDEKGTPITLLHVSQGNSSCGWSVWGNGMERRQIHAGTALLGIHVKDVDCLRFNTLRIELQQLDGWLGVTGFSKDSFLGIPESMLHYRVPEADMFLVGDDLEIRLQVHPQLDEGFVHGRNSKTIGDMASIDFASTSGISLRRYAQLLKALRSLLHFASLKPVYPVSVVGWQDGHSFEVGEHQVKQGIRLWTSLIHSPTSEIPFPDRWLFRYEDVRERFADLVIQALRDAEELAEAFNCYSTTVYHRLPREIENLCLVQALEAFDGVCNGTFRRRKLGQKIEQLVDAHASSLKGLIDGDEKFGKRVEETRHYYTHHNPEDLKRGMVAQAVDLIRLNERLRILFQTCILTRLGIPEGNFCRLRRQIAFRIMEYEY